MDAERSRTLWFAVLLTLTNGFLDAHTYIARGHVFANVQTANVIFSAIHVSEHQFSAALAHVWPLLAFIAGMLLASHINSADRRPVGAPWFAKIQRWSPVVLASGAAGSLPVFVVVVPGKTLVP